MMGRRRLASGVWRSRVFLTQHPAPLFGSEVGELVVGKGKVGGLLVVLLNYLILAEEVLLANE